MQNSSRLTLVGSYEIRITRGNPSRIVNADCRCSVPQERYRAEPGWPQTSEQVSTHDFLQRKSAVVLKRITPIQ